MIKKYNCVSCFATSLNVFLNFFKTYFSSKYVTNFSESLLDFTALLGLTVVRK